MSRFDTHNGRFAGDSLGKLYSAGEKQAAAIYDPTDIPDPAPNPPSLTPNVDNAAFDLDTDGSYTPSALSQQAADIIEEASGRPAAALKPITDRNDGYGQGGGYWSPSAPDEVNVDAASGNIHVAAHEWAHSNLMSDTGRMEVGGELNFPQSAEQARRNYEVNPAANLRSNYEMIATRADEESAAQGSGRAVTDRLGLGNQDQGFRSDPNGLLPATNSAGQIDSLAYPRSIALGGLNQIEQFGTRDTEGRPLGLGIDPRISDSEREEYYRILENMPHRLQRSFNNGYNKIPQPNR